MAADFSFVIGITTDARLNGAQVLDDLWCVPLSGLDVHRDFPRWVIGAVLIVSRSLRV